MPIVSKSYSMKGRLITLSYTFSDGVVRTLNVRGDTVSDASLFLLSHEAAVLLSKTGSDIDQAILNDSDVPSEDVTQSQLYKAWMYKGFRSEDPVEAYRYLSKVAAKVLALGLTVEQLATQFNVGVDSVNDVLAKWQYLKANKTDIAAYKNIKEGVR